MGYLRINQQKAKELGTPFVTSLCPFNALEESAEGLSINAACKLCKLCVKNGCGAVEYIEEVASPANTSAWHGIAVFAEIIGGRLHPVTLELLGEARRLADRINAPVFLLIIGCRPGEGVLLKLITAGADTIYLYDDPALDVFRVEPYANVFEDFITRVRPSCVLVGSTNLGRVLAPRVAARFRTGLTADCTMLDIRENGDLVQIRPAFGGNIMAQIVTKKARPQFASVRYKIFSALEKEYRAADIIRMDTAKLSKASGIRCLEMHSKGVTDELSEAETVIAVGRGMKPEDLPLVQALARRLNASVGCTRPLVEARLFDSRNQIGLSGRTVRPRLIVTLGISGAVQFLAGMQSSDYIIAINTDPNAPVFSVAHVAVIADYRSVLPQLLGRIEAHT